MWSKCVHQWFFKKKYAINKQTTSAYWYVYGFLDVLLGLVTDPSQPCICSRKCSMMISHFSFCTYMLHFWLMQKDVQHYTVQLGCTHPFKWHQYQCCHPCLTSQFQLLVHWQPSIDHLNILIFIIFPTRGLLLCLLQPLYKWFCCDTNLLGRFFLDVFLRGLFWPVMMTSPGRSASYSPSRHVHSWGCTALGALLPHAPNRAENTTEVFGCCDKIAGHGACIF